jgi:uncharacterized membrane protein YedE/YeeE
MVPILLIIGNKSFGISSSLRHICASCFPANISFFKYDWKKEIWNLFFVAGIVIGGFIAAKFMSNPNPIEISKGMQQTFAQYGITDFSGLVPIQIFNWNELLTFKGLSMMILGGFLVGFGTRYAGGCTSGHSIMGLSTLQWTSLIATICFMIGGFISAWFIVPFILN